MSVGRRVLRLRMLVGRTPLALVPLRSVAVVGAIVGMFFFACGGDETRTGFEATKQETVPPGEGEFGRLPSSQADGGVTGSCTADLQSVVDTQGNVVACPPDQGCTQGRCVPACDAAAASKGSLGCRYRVATPAFYSGYEAPCFAVFVANGWQNPARIAVSRDGQTYDIGAFGRIAEAGKPETSWDAVPASGVPAGKVAVLFLQAGAVGSGGGQGACPVTPAISSATGLRTTGRGKAWSITSDVPVTAYDIMPYGGASSFLPSAELLIPVTAWGKNYLAVLPPPGKPSGYSGEPWGQILAAEDDTTVTIAATADLSSGPNVPAVSPNTPATLKVDSGEFVQWQGGADMSGTVIAADKPIAFTGGHTYLCYSSKTSTGGGCDSGHQQIPPVSALGSEYAVVPYESRAPGSPESIKYRFMGAVDGTILTYDPAVPGAPSTLKTGEVVDFETTVGFVVKSQDAAHPFYIAQTMSGCQVNGSSSSLGDEEYVNVLPPAQFLNRYLFFTDPTYKTTNLVVTRMKTAKGFSDVEIDCIGKLSGFKPVGTSGTYESTTVDLLRNGSKNGSCQNGPHTVKSDGPVGITVWGLDYFASYAYPAGGSVAPINAVVVPPVPR